MTNEIQRVTDAQAVIGFLPKTGTVESDERIPIARAEGYHPLAIELALSPPAATAADKLRFIVLALIAAALVIFLFPLDRFFKPKTRDPGPMSIGGPVLEDSLSPENIRDNPGLKILVEIDRLYFQEGKLTEAIRAAEEALAQVPKKDRELWHNLYYRYWELLADAGSVHLLKTSTQAYLAESPEDPFANYYHSRAFLETADRIQSFSRETQDAYRREAGDIIRQIDAACNALNARTKHPDAASDAAVLTELYRRLRLQQAKCYVFIWKLGGFREDDHPDVAYRDRALDICESSALSDIKAAKQLKVGIYTQILDRWHWFEGPQIIQGSRRQRRELQQQLETLQKELKNPETL
jgi:tetratricopeptide (TPR) repeat protein